MRKCEKYLLKSKVAILYKKSDKQTEIISHFQNLLEENDLIDKAVFSHNMYAIYPTIATYKTLIESGFSKEQAEKEIEQVVLATGESTREMFKTIGKFSFFFPLFKKMCYTSTKTSYKKPFFDMKWLEQNKNTIAWDCHKCHYDDEFTKYNCKELTKIFCRLDDVMYGDIPTARWERTKTIGDGDEICNFCFKSTPLK